MSNCTSCNEFNPYQDKPYLCYSCRSGWVPECRKPKVEPVTIENMKAVQVCNIIRPAMKDCSKSAVSVWTNKSTGNEYYACPVCDSYVRTKNHPSVVSYYDIKLL